MQGFGYADKNNSRLCPPTYYYHDYFDFKMLGNQSVIVVEGTQQVWKNLAKKVPAKFVTSAEVTSLTPADYGVIVKTNKGEQQFDYVINTLALPPAIELLSHHDKQVSSLISKLTYNHYVTVMAELEYVSNLASFNLEAMLNKRTLGDAMFVYKRHLDSGICTINAVLPKNDQTDKQIIAQVNNSLDGSMGANIKNPSKASVTHWPYYFGYLSSNDLKNGWFSKFNKQVQGKDNILYVGSGLHFESLERSYNFSYQQTKKFFADKF